MSTPFGEYLEQIRRRNNLQQKQIAHIMGINPCYVSSIERGRKGPPAKAAINKLIVALELSEEEESELWYAHKLSDLTLRLSPAMSKLEFEFINELRTRLGTLSADELSVLRGVLKLSATKAAPPRRALPISHK